MTDGLNALPEASLPALLRAARATYAVAVRKALTAAGCEDLPRNGPYVLGAIAQAGVPLSQIIKELGVAKQAAGQLVDALVERGYVDRATDIEDRRRLTITLTRRGIAAAAASRAAVDRVDADLTGQVGPEYVAHTRATLAAIAHIGCDAGPIDGSDI